VPKRQDEKDTSLQQLSWKALLRLTDPLTCIHSALAKDYGVNSCSLFSLKGAKCRLKVVKQVLLHILQGL
jgi:hypothetical protein